MTKSPAPLPGDVEQWLRGLENRVIEVYAGNGDVREHPDEHCVEAAAVLRSEIARLNGLTTALDETLRARTIERDTLAAQVAGMEEHARDAERMLAEYRRQIEASGDEGWQPIDTAPRDGTWIFLFVPGHGPARARWGNVKGHAPRWISHTSCENITMGTHWRPVFDPPGVIQAPSKRELRLIADCEELTEELAEARAAIAALKATPQPDDAERAPRSAPPSRAGISAKARD